MVDMLKTADRVLRAALRSLCLLLFTALALILIANVYMRSGNDIFNFFTNKGMPGPASVVKALVPITSMHWFDEIVELLFASLVFYGAAALWAAKGHFCVGDWISPRLPWRWAGALYKMLVTLVSVVFLAIFFWYSLDLFRRTSELSTVFQIPKQVMYSCMPVSSLIMLAYSLVDIHNDVMQLIGRDSEGSGVQASQSM